MKKVIGFAIVMMAFFLSFTAPEVQAQKFTVAETKTKSFRPDKSVKFVGIWDNKVVPYDTLRKALLSTAVVVPSTVTATQFRLSALNTAPANATATGTLGEIRIVSGFIYVCTATNTWQRAALATW